MFDSIQIVKGDHVADTWSVAARGKML
jgi:hypothetical protein